MHFISRPGPSRARLALAIGVLLLWPAPGRAAETSPLPPARPVTALPEGPPIPAAEPFGPPMPASFPKGRELYLPLASAEAVRQGLPPEVADAVMRVESGYDPGAVGGVGERGLMQVLPSTAAMLGFKGTLDELADPQTNIRLGVRYLAGAWKLAGGDLCRTLMKYRAGHNEARMSALSVAYCRRAKSHLAALGSPLAAGALPAAEFGTAPAEAGASPLVRGRRVGPTRVARSGRAFWAAHTSRIRAIEARLPWKRGGILAGG